MQHSHVSFYNNGMQMGGVGVIPGINAPPGSAAVTVVTTPAEMQATIVDYLKSLSMRHSGSIQATNVDFVEALGIDLFDHPEVLELLKCNREIISEFPDDDSDLMTFEFIRPYQIHNITELKEQINRMKNGIMTSEIQYCYEGILDDCQSLIVGGEIIASKSSQKNCTTLYPRIRPFFTRLSGQVTAIPNLSSIQTTDDLRNEIRRGEAICVGNEWFRVSSNVREALERAKAPLSVTSSKELSDRNVYLQAFNEQVC